jgi:16S rRNA (adenine1518-N6/adenine1519-N6)-dimethyltransferase
MRSKPKKNLGQNFLTDTNIQRKIIGSIDLKADETVLEIGSGRGELTCLIAPLVRKIYALEIDAQLCKELAQNLSCRLNAEIINRDILKFNLAKELNSKGKIKVFGNIPYYITSPIIEHLFSHRDKISAIYLTVQKEFALRLAAKAGSKDYGAFSCFVQYYTEPKILFLIRKNSFYPAPKVDSCFLKLKLRRSPPVETEDENALFKIIRQAFGKRRKTLKNSLKGTVPEEKLNLFFARYNIRPDIRPERLSLQDFANLIKI